MEPLSNLLSLIDNRDPTISAQGWELCAALSLPERLCVARALAAQYRWGQAARCLLPDAEARRSDLLGQFAVTCTVAVLPLVRDVPLLHRFCRVALDEAASLTEDRRSHLLRQGQRALRCASLRGPPPLVARLVFDATMVLLSPRSRDHAARHATALACRAAQTRAWQQRCFFALLLPQVYPHEPRP